MGTGTFAKHRVRAGTRIITECWVIGLPKSQAKPLQIYREFLQLPPDIRQDIEQLHTGSARDVRDFADEITATIAGTRYEGRVDVRQAARVAAAFDDNGFEDKRRGEETLAALFPKIAKINHSCRPNAIMDIDQSAKQASVQVVENLKAGREIFIAYCPVVQPYSVRAATLEDGWGISCLCPDCDQSSPNFEDSRRRRRSVADLLKAADMLYKQDAKTRMRNLPDVYDRIIELLEEERLKTWDLGKAHLFVAEVYASGGRLGRAIRHGKQALEHAIVCLGTDDELVDHIRRKIEKWEDELHPRRIEGVKYL